MVRDEGGDTPGGGRLAFAGEYLSSLRPEVGALFRLKRHYQYMYSLSVRTNPFNPAANPVVLSN